MASSHIIFVSLFAAIIISLDLAACRGVGSGGRGVGGGRGGGYSGSGTTGGEDIFLPSTKTIIHFSFYLILYFARVQHLAIAFFLRWSHYSGYWPSSRAWKSAVAPGTGFSATSASAIPTFWWRTGTCTGKASAPGRGNGFKGCQSRRAWSAGFATAASK